MQDRECDEIIEIAEGPSVCAHQPSGRKPVAFQEESGYGIKVWIGKPYDDVLPETRCVLNALDCPVICEINVGRRMQVEAGVSFPKYMILEVAKTEWMSEALGLDRDIGLLLPFNLLVYEQSNGTVVEAVDPIAKFAIAGGDDLARVARAAKQTLLDVVDRVAADLG